MSDAAPPLLPPGLHSERSTYLECHVQPGGKGVEGAMAESSVRVSSLRLSSVCISPQQGFSIVCALSQRRVRSKAVARQAGTRAPSKVPLGLPPNVRDRTR